MAKVRPSTRPPIFGRQVAQFKFQKWFLSAGRELCSTLTSILLPGLDAVDLRLAMPPGGSRSFRLSRRGYKPEGLAESDPEFKKHW